MSFNDGLPNILPITADIIFKSTFTATGAKPALVEFLSDILGRNFTDVILRPNEQPKLEIFSKQEVFDVNCIATDGKSQFDVEMQASHMDGDSLSGNEHKNICSRAIY
jgi:hypothetical protein